MRIAALSIALFLSGGTNILAQEQVKTLWLAPVKAEAGIFGQTSFGNRQESMNFLGLQYKKWINERKGLRVIAGYSNYNTRTSPFSFSSAGDTSIEKSTHTNINLGIVGAGVEMQRHFYKKVYLFAALELRGGYGSGSQDTMTSKSFNAGIVGTNTIANKAGTGNANMYYLGVMPSVGAKLQFNRIVLGTEITGIETSIKQIKVDGGHSFGVFDMALGNISQRFFVNYRF